MRTVCGPARIFSEKGDSLPLCVDNLLKDSLEVDHISLKQRNFLLWFDRLQRIIHLVNCCLIHGQTAEGRS